MIGIIGESGSGKSTLINILAGLYKPNSGKIIVDDLEINDLNIINWRLGIAYVQQESYLEKGTLLSNIAFLDNTPNYEKALKVVKLACLEELVGNEKLGDIVVSEFGKNLSVGQKQRVMIARALYNNCNLILFDESTSALDNQTEKEITDACLELKRNNVTVVIIAHRYSTLKHTDKIFEISDSKIKNTYSYDQLIKTKD
jgi:ABC-type bacteriocin/lantibiotic exporter with double-glycine peptidase domain